jgi:hypothetical protein
MVIWQFELPEREAQPLEYIYCIAMRKMLMLKKHSGEADKE